jgi:hypothetical protein
MKLDQIEYSDDDSHKFSPPILCRAAIEEFKTEAGEVKTGPQKITGYA